MAQKRKMDLVVWRGGELKLLEYAKPRKGIVLQGPGVEHQIPQEQPGSGTSERDAGFG